MLCIFSIILEISNAETFTQTVNITKYGEKIEMKKYAACHLYDYENETSTIIVKIGEDHEFLDINDIQIGINHIYLPPEPGGIDKFLIQWITGERTSRKPSSEREKQLICRKEETDCDIQVNFSGKKVLKIRGITRRFCKDSYITIGKRPGEDYNRALTPNGEIETSKEDKEFFSMGLIIGISSSFAWCLILAALVGFLIQRKRKKLKEQEESIWRSEEDANHRVEHIYEEIDDSLIGQNPSYHVYDTLGYAKTGRLKSNGYDTLQL